MQVSTFQSMPCVSEDIARANVSSMLTRVATEKGGVKLINIEIKESNGMFIAVATYEVTEPEKENKEEEKQGEGDSKNSRKPEGQNDDDDPLLYAAMQNRQLQNGELLPEQENAANFTRDPDVPVHDTRNDSYNDGTAPMIKEAILVSPTVPPPDAVLADAEDLEKQVKTDFNEPSAGNVPVDPDMMPPNLKPDEASPEPTR